VDALALMDVGEGRKARTRLLLVGDGEERPALERRARAAGVADRVVFAGERDDVPDLLTAMDVLAAPSRTETFGMALIEALAAGLPVRWSSGPALSELPPVAAPGARRIPSDPAVYAAELALLRQCRTPLAQPQAVRHYDIARLAPLVAELYDRLGAVPAATTAPRTVPLRPVPLQQHAPAAPAKTSR